MKLAPLFKSPHLGNRRDEVGVGLRPGTCGVGSTGNAGQLLWRERALNLQSGLSVSGGSQKGMGGLESQSQASRRERGAESPLANRLVGEEARATS